MKIITQIFNNSKKRFVLTFLITSITISTNQIVAQDFTLDEQFSKIESYLVDMEKLNIDVSKAPVKWHLLHVLEVINGVYKEAKNSNPENYKSGSNIQWFYVATFGKIPRGKVTSPEGVNPSYDISEKQMNEALEKAKESVKNWKTLQKNSFYAHHVLLNLNKSKIKRFLKVHTNHHLKIVKDILKN